MLVENRKTIAALAGVMGVEVNFSTHRASVRWDDTRIRLSEILTAVASAGYRATPYDRDGADQRRRSERRDLLWRLFVACFGMMQVMMYAVPVYLAGDSEMSADIEQLMRWASFVLTVPVVVYAAAPFFTGAWRDLSARRLGMDVPVAMGVAIAFGASATATVSGGAEVYYDSVTMFVFLLLLGRYLELVARQRAGAALAHLERLIPEFAHRLSAYPGSSLATRVPVASLKAGDHALVKPGETFPADGEVIEGSGSASEALLTGESCPVTKEAGSAVTGGAVNLTSPLIVRITRVTKSFCIVLIGDVLACAGHSALAQNAARGRQLYETYCGDCHYQRVHQRERDKSLVKTMDDLRVQVNRWAPQTKMPLDAQDIADIVDYLNSSFYRLEK